MSSARCRIQNQDTIQTNLSVLTAACWLMMLVTFSLPDRKDSLAGGSLDVIGLIKLAVRGTVILVLLWRTLGIVSHVEFPAIRRRALPSCIFLAWALMSVVWSPLRSVSFAQAASLATLLLITILTAHCCRTERTSEYLLRQLCLILSVLSSLLLACYCFVPSVGSMTRDGAGLFHATNTAATASLGLILLISTWLIWNFGWSKRMMWATLPHIAVLVISANRLCFLVNTIVLLTVFYFYGSRLMASVLVAILCGLGTLYLLFDPTHTLFASFGGEVVSYASRGQNLSQLSALSGREEMWTAQWNSFMQSPLIGHGYFVSSSLGQLYVWYEWANYTAHNLLLQVAVTTGIVGLILFMVGVVVPYVQSMRLLQANPVQQRLGDYLGAMGIWFVGWSTMNESIMGPVQPESVVFFVLLGLAIGNSVIDKSNSAPTPSSP